MNVTQGLHRAVQQHPDEVATICADRVRTHRESVGPVDALPLNAAGQVLKRELRKPYWEGQARAVH